MINTHVIGCQYKIMNGNDTVSFQLVISKPCAKATLTSGLTNSEAAWLSNIGSNYRLALIRGRRQYRRVRFPSQHQCTLTPSADMHVATLVWTLSLQRKCCTLVSGT